MPISRKAVLTRCLGLNCRLGGWFLSTDHVNCRLCPSCRRLSDQQDRRTCQMAVVLPAERRTGYWQDVD